MPRMQIQYFGGLGFVLKSADATVALATEKFDDAQIVIPADPDAKIAAAKNQTVFDWPGEYESRGVSVALIPVGKEKKSRVAKILIEEMAVVHLDGVAEPLTEKEEERIGTVDILLISTGKNAALDAKQIKNTIEGIEPKIVVPMNFAVGEEIEFAKNLGCAEAEPENDLKLRASSLPSDRMELRILKARK